MAKTKRLNRRKVDKIFRYMLMINITLLVLLGVSNTTAKRRSKALEARVHVLARVVCSEAAKGEAKLICKEVLR